MICEACDNGKHYLCIGRKLCSCGCDGGKL